MSGVESAASLFGGDEAGPDPFAALGSDEAQPVTDQNSQHATRYSETPGEAASSLFGEEQPSYAAQNWDPAAAEGYQYEASSYPQPADTQASYSEPQQEGWYDQYGQWQTGQYVDRAPTSVAHQYQTPTTQTTHSNPYDPYAPQPAAVTTPSYTPSAPAPPTQYSTYQPPTPGQYNAYEPAAPATYAQPSYTQAAPASYAQPAYAPSVPKQTTSYSYPANNTYAQPVQRVSSIPPPPAPTSTANFRPKTANAFDPPIPARKSKRAVSAGYALRSTSPAVGQQTYPVYDAASLPPPPPVPAQYAPYSQSLSQNLPHASAAPPPPASLQSANSWDNHGASDRYRSPPAPPQQYHSPPPPTNGYVSTSYQSQPDAQANHDMQTAVNGMSNVTWEPNGLNHGSQSDLFVSNAHATTSNDWPRDDLALGHAPSSDDIVPRGASPYDIPQTQSFDEIPHTSTANGYSGAASVVARAASPAVQSWTQSPRTSPELPRAPIHKVVSPPPSASQPPPKATSPYDPKLSERVSSPGAESIRSHNASPGITSAYQSAKEPAYSPVAYQPKAASRVSSPANGHAYGVANGIAYAPASNTPSTSAYEPSNRAKSPPAASIASQSAPHPGPYTPASYENRAPGTKSPSNSWQAHPAPPSDPYAPPKQDLYAPRDRSASNGSSFSNATTQPLRPPPAASYAPVPYATAYEGLPYDSSALGQDIYTSQNRTQYAPSPSLVGSNDPLGRTAARVPVFNFGFGGKIVTCFHGASTMTGGFDVALSSKQSTDVQVRLLHKLIPQSALDTSTAVFPGPLFSDPGSPTNSLVRTAASQVKAKKAKVIKYLEERADEIKHAISYLNAGTEDRRQADGKLAIVSLLKIMVENDGSLTGTAQIDSAVRVALVPRLAESSPSQGDTSASAMPTFSSIPEYPGIGSVNFDSNETPIATTTLRPSALAKIQEFLLRGERRQAYNYALDGKLWAHAMVIASGIDKDAWKEVVNEFLRTELSSTGQESMLGLSSVVKVAEPPTASGREWLRVAYSLYSGQGAAAVQELKPPSQLSKGIGGLQVPAPAMTHITPMSPHFPAATAAAGIPTESLSKWPEAAAAMIMSPMTPDTSSALTALGDYLISNGWVEGAHACYLLSPITSPMGGVSAPSVRVVLVGSRSPHNWPNFHKDPDPIIFSEIAEFALSLATPPKGQEPFHGLPHLQAYRFIRAMSLAEIGHNDLAKRYCEAITNSLGRNPSAYVTPPFVEQLRGLMDRLMAAPQLDKSGSWISGKMSKPSLDGIGGWLEGRLTKFIAGDGESPGPTQQALPDAPGVFAQYSTISSTNTSASPSPTLSHVNPYSALPGAPPRRSGSAMGSPSNSFSTPMNRSSSAMEYSRPDMRRGSPGPRTANPSTTTFAQAQSFGQPSFGQPTNAYTHPNGHASKYANDTLSRPSLDTTSEEENTAQTGSWWGSSYGEDSTAPTPTASNFMRVDDAPDPESSSSGFISLMDTPNYSATPSPPVMSRQASSAVDDEDDEDLGFGNSKKSSKAKSESDGLEGSSKTATPARPDPKPAPAASSSSGGSWLGRLWKRSDTTTPGPIKASLGEETSFYYDKELKKWVNKKAGSEEPSKPAAPPPPPSRAQTASPGHSNPFPSTTPPNAAPPRSASSIDLSVSPPSNKANLRVRSNLVPQESMSVPGTPMNGAGPPIRPPLSAGLAPPGSQGRPKSSASKRNIRNRYVDILQEGGA
ncbi:hypothetical protein HWV62_7038 [Athelia sp. TMB]|nr:hypothetical protein HWV62_7038 [Athelia sp. TMB]